MPICNSKKLVEIYDQSGKPYNTNRQIKFKTPMFPEDLCDYSDGNILVDKVMTDILIPIIEN